MADTGYQSCLAGAKLLHRLGLQTHHLIPVTMQMSAANDKQIRILGALILRISGKSTDGTTLQTRQIVYFTDGSDKVYLSKQACIVLGMITDNFPNIGETNQALATFDRQTQDVKPPLQSWYSMTATCTCPRRQPPPPVWVS